MRHVRPAWVLRKFLWMLLALVIVPHLTRATNWPATLGAQSSDAAKQAMAFLPNEVWIDAGDSITWTSDTGESHTVTFLKQPEAPAAPGTFTGTSVTRPSFNAAGPDPFGCAGNNQGGASPNTESGLPFSGGTCVNSGPICDDTLQALQPPAASDACAAKSFVVTFPTAGNYKLVCLIHSDMTGVVHVLASGAPYPHTPDFYSDEARDQARDLINDSDNPREERNDYPRAAHEVIMTGELTATAGGKQYLAIMRYFPQEITVSVGDTVEWTNQGPDEPHTVTFLPKGANEPPPAGPGSTPGGIADPNDSAEIGSITNVSSVTPNGCGGMGGFTCFSSGLIGPGNQDQTGLPQTPTGVTRVRVQFNSAGKFSYYCTLHDELGMAGVVNVEAKH
jgi:plastocyanin